MYRKRRWWNIRNDIMQQEQNFNLKQYALTVKNTITLSQINLSNITGSLDNHQHIYACFHGHENDSNQYTVYMYKIFLTFYHVIKKLQTYIYNICICSTNIYYKQVSGSFYRGKWWKEKDAATCACTKQRIQNSV